jgi:hypothetical protein
VIDSLSEKKKFHKWNRIGHNTISNQWKIPQLTQKFS